MAAPTETPVPERQGEAPVPAAPAATTNPTAKPAAAKPKPKARPGGARKPAAKAKPAAKQKGPALYHLFSKSEKGVLTPVGDVTAKTAEGAASEFVKNPPSGQGNFAKKVGSGEASVVVIPDRNYTEVGAEVETKTTVRIRARK